MKHFLTLLLTVISCSAFGQILEPVTWDMSSEATAPGEYTLTFKANIDAGWSIYSQHTDPSGPVPTSFYFDEGDHYSREGEVAEKGKRKEGPDPLFDGVTVIKFPKGPVYFTQKITATDLSKPITGYFEFMTCDDERCLPPTEVDFSFALEPYVATTIEEPVEDKGNAQVDTPTQKEEPTAGATEEEVAVTTASAADEPLAVAKAIAQFEESGNIVAPVRWEAEVATYGERQVITFTANLKEGWNLYSQHTEDNGPIPTSFYIGEGDEKLVFEERGDMKEGDDPVFGVVVKKYEHGPVTFTKMIEGSEPLSGAIEYMSCDATRCIPGELPFSMTFNPLSVTLGDGAAAPSEPSDDGGHTSNESDLGSVNVSSLVGLGYGSDEFLANIANKNPIGYCEGDGEAVATALANESSGKGLGHIFWLGFLGGLIALLTPCVFPMIPLTVSFFTKGAENRSKGIRNALTYGFFIFLVYILLSVPFHLMDSLDPDILNQISTNVWLNIFFFVIFMVFAFSFFGYFELTIPQSWTNKASAAEGAGGLVGIFFMALTLALVSFSCTGPILGSLLVGALSGDGGAMQLTAGMGGFGFALALPFALFAAFPGMMKSLPQSGGWLNSVKVVLGFAEVALAFKFLSNADLVDHWGLLKLEPFLIIWILCGIGIVLYLLGYIKFPHDSPLKKISPVRWGFAALTLAFTVYLMTGFRVNPDSGSYRPLSLLSGLAPPVCYSITRPCECPADITCFKDLETGLAVAKRENKPVMLDFTGYACVNCRKMEENVWPTSKVISMLKDDYVVISLYVDDKEELATPLTVTKSSGRERELDEVGEKWAHYQEIVFQQNTQPQYALISPDGHRLNIPVSYTPDEEEYAAFLRCGLDNFERLQNGETPLIGER